jgi:hypothetical protein
MTMPRGDSRPSAERTASIVVDAARSGAPLCIPGARESRPQSDAAPAATRAQAAAHVSTITFSELNRLAYAREGGGALSERPAQHDGVAVRFWRLVTRRFRFA